MHWDGGPEGETLTGSGTDTLSYAPAPQMDYDKLQTEDVVLLRFKKNFL